MSEFEFKLLSKLSGISGIRYPQPENYKKWGFPFKLIWNIYAYIVQIGIVMQAMSLITKLTKNVDDIGIACASAVGAIYPLSLLLKLIVFNRYSRQFAAVFAEMRSITSEFRENPFDDNYVKFHDGTSRKIAKSAVLKGATETLATFAVTLFFLVQSYVVGVPEDLNTPAFTWTPYDISENPAYAATVLYELFIYVNVTLRNAVIDGLFWMMLIVPTIHLRYLRRLMHLILEKSQAKRKEIAGVEELRKWRNELNDDFTWWIRYHKRVLGTIQQFTVITSPFLGVNYLTTLIALTLTGLVTISTSSWNVYQQIVICGVVGSNTAQLYLVSLAGDWLSESGERAAEGGYTDFIFSTDNDLMRKYLFVCARTKHPLQIKFGGINRLCSENFEQLIRVTVTYLVTIVQLRGEIGEATSRVTSARQNVIKN